MALRLNEHFRILFCRTFLVLNLFCFSVFTQIGTAHSQIFLPANSLVHASGSDKLDIYCHEGANKSLVYFWRSVFLELVKAPSEYKVFVGENVTSVAEQYQEHSSAWLFPILPWQDSVLSLPAFSQRCVGIIAKGEYTLQVAVRGINFWKVLQTAIGILLFFCAPTLSRNTFFHYTTGVSFGIIASILILIFILSKLIPKKPAAYSILIFGVSAVLYGLQLLFSNIQEIIVNYSNAVLVYLTVSAFASFLICYRLGPVSNVRTLNLIQWTMQLVGILLIFFSSEYQEASTALVLVIMTVYAVPASWVAKMKCIWCYYFPPKVKLLTEMEYIEQGSKETKKALENLRTYCRSPECNAWTTVRRLKDPVRFARFIDGESHLNDDEILEYDSDPVFFEIPRDEDEDDDSDVEVPPRPTANHSRYSYGLYR